MSVACPKCDFQNPGDARFCGHCAAPLSRSTAGAASGDSPSSDRPGNGALIAGKYQIGGPLGRGGMGVVYEAEDIKLKRAVALKFLPDELAADPQAVERFRREARAASALNHPHICTIYDIDEHEGRPFLALELLEGRTLRDDILARRPDIGRIVDLGIQIANGLEAAHAKGIIHRDIKPGNIFVTDSGQVKILDFGLAKLLPERRPKAGAKIQAAMPTMTVEDPLTGPGSAVGTLAYMSPEQALGRDLDARTDLFSLGVVLYEMATGHPPFRGDASAAVFDGILHQAPTSLVRLNPDVPEALERIIAKALEKDREVRYQSARDVQVDLTRLKRERDSGRTAAVPGLPGSADIRSLAVLPFTNMSADKENEYFCDGLSEELINALANIRELRVVARTSAFAYKGREVDIREVGRKLDARAVLEGSVRKSGPRLRITAQLIDVENGYHLWSGQFDREMKDIFGIQEEIALAIADQLKIKLLKDEKDKILKRATEDPEAYELYLKGLHFWRRRYEKGLQKSLQFFQMAAEKDPGYALPYVGIADAFGILGVYGFMPPKPAYARARAAADRALQIDPGIAEAYASLGWIAMWYDRDWEAAERHFLKAIRMKPDYPEAHLWYGNLLACRRQFDEAVREMRKGQELEPLEPAPPVHVGWALYYARRFDESVEKLGQVAASDPEFPLSYMVLTGDFAAQKMWDEAIAAVRKFVDLTPGSGFALSLLGWVYGAAGLKEEALKVLERLDGMSPDRYVGPLFRAIVWTGLGEPDKALDYLEKACEERDSMVALMGIWPILDTLRAEPRFQAVLKEMGLE